MSLSKRWRSLSANSADFLLLCPIAIWEVRLFLTEKPRRLLPFLGESRWTVLGKQVVEGDDSDCIRMECPADRKEERSAHIGDAN